MFGVGKGGSDERMRFAGDVRKRAASGLAYSPDFVRYGSLLIFTTGADPNRLGAKLFNSRQPGGDFELRYLFP